MFACGPLALMQPRGGVAVQVLIILQQQGLMARVSSKGQYLLRRATKLGVK